MGLDPQGWVCGAPAVIYALSCLLQGCIHSQHSGQKAALQRGTLVLRAPGCPWPGKRPRGKDGHRLKHRKREKISFISWCSTRTAMIKTVKLWDKQGSLMKW